MAVKVYDWRSWDGKVAGSAQVDFDRNREGIYGGLPEARPDKKGRP